MAFSPDGRMLATSYDRTVRLWDLATGDRLRTLTGHTDNARGMAFSPDGRMLATASYDRTVRLWNPVTGDCLQTLTGHAVMSPTWRSARTGACCHRPRRPDGAAMELTTIGCDRCHHRPR